MTKVSTAQITAMDQLVRRIAADEVMPQFGNLSADMITTKSHATDLVTVADQRSEAALIAGLAPIFPTADIFGEETVAADPSRLDALQMTDLSVIIDPIDGTWNYAHGIAVFGMIIAVISRGQTIAGLIYDPISGETLSARAGYGAFLATSDGKTTPVRQPTLASDVPINVLIAEGLQASYAEWTGFGAVSRVTALGCSAHEYRLLCKGHYHAAFCKGLMPWDHAAGELIFRETGGISEVDGIGAYTPDLREGDLILAHSVDIITRLKSRFRTPKAGV